MAGGRRTPGAAPAGGREGASASPAGRRKAEGRDDPRSLHGEPPGPDPDAPVARSTPVRCRAPGSLHPGYGGAGHPTIHVAAASGRAPSGCPPGAFVVHRVVVAELRAEGISAGQYGGWRRGVAEVRGGLAQLAQIAAQRGVQGADEAGVGRCVRLGGAAASFEADRAGYQRCARYRARNPVSTSRRAVCHHPRLYVLVYRPARCGPGLREARRAELSGSVTPGCCRRAVPRTLWRWPSARQTRDEARRRSAGPASGGLPDASARPATMSAELAVVRMASSTARRSAASSQICWPWNGG